MRYGNGGEEVGSGCEQENLKASVSGQMVEAQSGLIAKKGIKKETVSRKRRNETGINNNGGEESNHKRTGPPFCAKMRPPVQTIGSLAGAPLRTLALLVCSVCLCVSPMSVRGQAWLRRREAKEPGSCGLPLVQ